LPSRTPPPLPRTASPSARKTLRRQKWETLNVASRLYKVTMVTVVAAYRGQGAAIGLVSWLSSKLNRWYIYQHCGCEVGSAACMMKKVTNGSLGCLMSTNIEQCKALRYCTYTPIQPNIGREGHLYLTHILRKYHSSRCSRARIGKRCSPAFPMLTFFCQEDEPGHEVLYERYMMGLRFPQRSFFGKQQKSLCLGSEGNYPQADCGAKLGSSETMKVAREPFFAGFPVAKISVPLLKAVGKSCPPHPFPCNERAVFHVTRADLLRKTHTQYTQLYQMLANATRVHHCRRDVIFAGNRTQAQYCSGSCSNFLTGWNSSPPARAGHGFCMDRTHGFLAAFVFERLWSFVFS